MEHEINFCVVHSGTAPLDRKLHPYSSEFEPSGPAEYVQGNLDKVCEWLRQAGEADVDIACTHESIKGEGKFFFSEGKGKERRKGTSFTTYVFSMNYVFIMQ